MRWLNYLIAGTVFVALLLLDIRIDLTGSPIYVLYAHRLLGIVSLKDILDALAAPLITVNGTVVSIRMALLGAALFLAARVGFRRAFDSIPALAVMGAVFMALFVVFMKLVFWMLGAFGVGGVLILAVVLYAVLRIL